MAKKPDWTRIKAEYLAGGVSQRMLAEAHGVSYKTLRERAVKEKWTELRRKTGEKTAQKMAEDISDAKVKKISKVVDLLLTQLEAAARQNTRHPVQIRTTKELDDGTVRVTVKTEYEEAHVIDKQGLRLLAQTAKDLDGIMRAQRLEDKGEGAQNVITVRFENEDYSI